MVLKRGRQCVDYIEATPRKPGAIKANPNRSHSGFSGSLVSAEFRSWRGFRKIVQAAVHQELNAARGALQILQSAVFKEFGNAPANGGREIAQTIKIIRTCSRADQAFWSATLFFQIEQALDEMRKIGF